MFSRCPKFGGDHMGKSHCALQHAAWECSHCHAEKCGDLARREDRAAVDVVRSKTFLSFLDLLLNCFMSSCGVVGGGGGGGGEDLD